MAAKKTVVAVVAAVAAVARSYSPADYMGQLQEDHRGTSLMYPKCHMVLFHIPLVVGEERHKKVLADCRYRAMKVLADCRHRAMKVSVGCHHYMKLAMPLQLDYMVMSCHVVV